MTRAQRYDRSEKGRARHRRYNTSAKGRARARRYHEAHPQISVFGTRFRMPSPEFAEFSREVRDERKAVLHQIDIQERRTGTPGRRGSSLGPDGPSRLLRQLGA